MAPPRKLTEQELQEMLAAWWAELLPCEGATPFADNTIKTASAALFSLSAVLVSRMEKDGDG